MALAIISVTPAFLALLTTAARKAVSGITQSWTIGALIAALFVWLLSFISGVGDHGPVAVSIPWVPQLGLSLSLYLDGLALLFSLMIVGIGALIVVYAGYYFDDPGDLDRFTVRILAFMSAMLVLVLAGNLLTLFIGWELTSVISFLLISFDADKPDARSGALRALLVTGGGGLALLVGLVLLGTAAGSMELPQVLAAPGLRESPWYAGFTVLILMGCFAKSAQWPFHFWLPGAMNAPTPVSAYLHSATMVKAGIYLLLRLYPVLGDTPLWQNGLLAIGLITMLMGAVFALRQRDLKAALAYSTISQLGILTALISLPHGEGLKAALVGILAHGMYKATLFLVVGAVDHAAGTRQLDRLGGLARRMPGWAAVAVIAGLSMAGLPPLLGFVAKESLLDAMLGNTLALVIIMMTAALTVAMALILVWDVFFGERAANMGHVHEPASGLLVGPAVLAGGSLLGGLGLQALIVPLVGLSLPGELHLELFSGMTTPFLLSLLAVVSGLAIFGTRSAWRRWPELHLPAGTEIYAAIIHGVERVGDLVLTTQGGKLRYYLTVILASVIVLQATAGLAHVIGFPLDFTFNGTVDALRMVFLLLALGMMLASILFRNHLLAALSLGVAGYSVGGLFLIEPAPDVALVQFMVETLGTVLLIVMLSRIRAAERRHAMNVLWRQSRIGLTRDVVISVLIGGGTGLFALAALNSRPTPNTIATWHLEHAEQMLGFPDVVGAIVTDFRGMDTIIESTVFGVAALGVLTLLTRPASRGHWPRRIAQVIGGKRNAVPELHAPAPGSETVAHPDHPVSKLSTPMTRIAAQIIMPLAFLIALAQLLYGGDGPGDGFTAGVVSGLGVALCYIVFGYDEVRKQVGWLHARALIGGGLALIVGNAIFPLLLGHPFLAHLDVPIELPAHLHISSTLSYETGIFLTILGSVTMVMEAIAHPKEVEQL